LGLRFLHLSRRELASHPNCYGNGSAVILLSSGTPESPAVFMNSSAFFRGDQSVLGQYGGFTWPRFLAVSGGDFLLCQKVLDDGNFLTPQKVR
jgi:hypothetical protein